MQATNRSALKTLSQCRNGNDDGDGTDDVDVADDDDDDSSANDANTAAPAANSTANICPATFVGATTNTTHFIPPQAGRQSAQSRSASIRLLTSAMQM